MCSDLDRKRKEGNIMLKVDISKAYDRVQWSFVLHCLRQIGFDEQSVSVVFRAISGCFFSISWAGAQHGFFPSCRGLRQGDPLSPALFIITMDVFSRMLNREMDGNRISRFACARKQVGASHLLFADDMLIFSSANRNSVARLKEIISVFCASSGHQFNLSKTKVFCSKLISPRAKRSLCSFLGCSPGNLPTTYLGCPLFSGRPRIAMFDGVIRNISNKVAGWKSSLLSAGGKIALAQSVLAALPVHVLSAVSVPKAVLNRVDHLICSFLWDAGGEKRRHWLKGSKLLQPYEDGGLNVRSMATMMDCLHARLAWRVINRSSPWAKFVADKYPEDGRCKRSSLWSKLQPLIKLIKEDSIIQIGRGSCNFWDSPWCTPRISKPEGILFNGSVAELFNSTSLRDQILPLISSAARSKFLELQLVDQPDKWLWTKHSSGELSVKTFFKSLCLSVPSKEWKKVWKPVLPLKMSHLIWKIKHGILLVDSFMQKKGFQLASRCICCSSHSIESENHLLFQSDLARQIWRWLGELLGMAWGASNFTSIWREWVTRNHLSIRRATINQLALYVGVWEIWKFQCAAIYGDPIPWPLEKHFKISVAAFLKIRMEVHQPRLEMPRLLHASFVWSEVPYNLSPLPPAISWAPGSEEASVNIACHGNASAFLFRSASGRVLGGASRFINPAAFLADIPLVLSTASDLAFFFRIPRMDLQWDRDSGSFASRKWALASSLPPRICSVSLIKRSGNSAARALAKFAAANLIPSASLFSSSSLPLEVRALVSRDRERLL